MNTCFILLLCVLLLAACEAALAGDVTQAHAHVLNELSRIRVNLTSPLPLGGVSLAMEEADGVYQHSLEEGKVVFKSGSKQAINRLAQKLHYLAVEDYNFDMKSASGRARAAAIKALAARVNARRAAAARAAERAEKAMETFISFRSAADAVTSLHPVPRPYLTHCSPRPCRASNSAAHSNISPAASSSASFRHSPAGDAKLKALKARLAKCKAEATATAAAAKQAEIELSKAKAADAALRSKADAVDYSAQRTASHLKTASEVARMKVENAVTFSRQARVAASKLLAASKRAHDSKAVALLAISKAQAEVEQSPASLAMSVKAAKAAAAAAFAARGEEVSAHKRFLEALLHSQRSYEDAVAAAGDQAAVMKVARQALSRIAQLVDQKTKAAPVPKASPASKELSQAESMIKLSRAVVDQARHWHVESAIRSAEAAEASRLPGSASTVVAKVSPIKEQSVRSRLSAAQARLVVRAEDAAKAADVARADAIRWSLRSSVAKADKKVAAQAAARAAQAVANYAAVLQKLRVEKKSIDDSKEVRAAALALHSAVDMKNTAVQDALGMRGAEVLAAAQASAALKRARALYKAAKASESNAENAISRYSKTGNADFLRDIAGRKSSETSQASSAGPAKADVMLKAAANFASATVHPGVNDRALADSDHAVHQKGFAVTKKDAQAVAARRKALKA